MEDDRSSSYGTPDHGNAMAAGDSSAKDAFSDNDTSLVVGAGRSLKTMLNDLTAVLQEQAHAKIFISGEMHLRIDGREDYTLSLVIEDQGDPSSLKVKIGKRKDVNGASSNAVSMLKRKHDAAPVDSTDQDVPKRRRIDAESGDKEDANPAPKPPAQKDVVEPSEAADEPTPRRILQKLNNISEQIHWVEQCRRIADEAHDKCEETWRATSATFHDDTRRTRDRHEAWMVEEMAWQRNMLLGLSNDIKGLYPLGHSLKWVRLDSSTWLQLTEN